MTSFTPLDRIVTPLSVEDRAPYAWALTQLRVPEAHTITRGSHEVVVAVIDHGYRFHPDHHGHLWVNPHPTRGDVHGWDFDQNDATLEYDGPGPDQPGFLHHQAFLVGEVAAVAPECPIMVLRAGFNPLNGGGWVDAIHYAVDHGARILVMPQAYLASDPSTGESLFHQGTDFSYPVENVPVMEAFDMAYRAGCLIFRGTGDNRGRRVAVAQSAVGSAIAVGSSNRDGHAANIAISSDYTEFAAPSGQRGTADVIWGTGGNGGYVPFDGGCMSSAFAGGVAALTMSRYPEFDNAAVREIMRSTAQGAGWDPYLGHGVLDAYAALTLPEERMKRGLSLSGEYRVTSGNSGQYVHVHIGNTGVFDLHRVMVVLYDGDPLTPANPRASLLRPDILLRRQLGHTIVSVPGLESVEAQIRIPAGAPPVELHAQAYALDIGAAGVVATRRLDTADALSWRIGSDRSNRS